MKKTQYHYQPFVFHNHVKRKIILHSDEPDIEGTQNAVVQNCISFRKNGKTAYFFFDSFYKVVGSLWVFQDIINVFGCFDYIVFRYRL